MQCHVCNVVASGLRDIIRGFSRILGESENSILGKWIRKVPAIEGDSPVSENILSRWIILPSRAEHEKFRLNLPRPRGKAKYSQMTDSVTVP